MEVVKSEPVQAKPPQPSPDWKWSERFQRWYAPGTSPVNGITPPAHAQFKPGVSDPRQSRGGQLSARTRELIAEDNRLLDRLAKRWIASMLKGDNRAREQYLDRSEGKVEQSIHATLETRYTIEEVGTPYVLVPEQVTSTASDNIHSVALSADASAVAPVQVESVKSDPPRADPDAVIPPPTDEAPQGGPMPQKIPASDE